MTSSKMGRHKRGRLRAASLCTGIYSLLVAIGLTGCSSLGKALSESALGLLPFNRDISEAAADTDAASVYFDIGGNGTGLFFLRKAGHGLTFWQIGTDETIVLRDGMLDATRGLPPELRMTAFRFASGHGNNRPPSPRHSQHVTSYELVRTWARVKDGFDSGQARARWGCEHKTRRIELPLVTKALQKCTETLAWNRGATTRSVYWRDPETHHIWSADVVAWPGAPTVSWRVARPWW